MSQRIKASERIALVDKSNLMSPMLVDTFQRKHNYLRISLTERCNLRCFYCMPSEGVELSPAGKLLTNEEVLRLATLFVKSGVTKIRLTGGEPTVRKGLDDIISALNALRPLGLQAIAMTSNGLALYRRLPELVEKGLSHLNLSLDTLDPYRFEIMTRRRGHDAVLRTLDLALSLPLKSVKLNVVVIRGLNEDEILDFVEMTKDNPISIRFIEFMPFTGNKWEKQRMVPSSQLIQQISERHPSLSRGSAELNETAQTWKIPGYQGNIGFISSMSDLFCSTCNRLRLTADGQIKVCLFDPKEVSLRDELRRNATDEELLSVIGQAVKGKHEKHAGMENIDVINNRPMILIGSARHTTPSLWGLRVSHRPIHRPGHISSHFTSGHRLKSTNALTHLDQHGRADMVDVSDKKPTKRTATATGRIYIPEIAYELLTSTYPSKQPQTDAMKKAQRKGDALTVAQVAATMAAKKTYDLIPLCHPLSLSKVSVSLTPEFDSALPHKAGRRHRASVMCEATVTCEGKTGVEMEALTAVSVGLLTVWDMLKAVAGKQMEIGEVYVTRKTGGQSGDFVRDCVDNDRDEADSETT
ncbi:hypothetical protein AMATHDRAFT_74301 [Amanita thiersii Skay4041]|uniref:Radical SAM core domain-containing protein n=1 Tax=Amanita thiersii Skay4041 TaxID=703135 RepID=A0A2A9NVD2_9AGAR|nr:hypothetical protein AMATHDRAFT_74301 [Amanita thiersii Skay4041]